MPASRLGVWWLPAIGLAAGALLIVPGQVRLGGYVIAGTLGVGALLRLVLPRSRAGGLVVRSRAGDVLALSGLAVAVGAMATMVDMTPRR